MKLTTGYKKPIASSGTDAQEQSSNNSYLLLAGGGHKALSELVSPADLTNYVTIGSDQTITGVKTFSQAINADITGNADTLDNFHASSFYENGYVMFNHTIDASGLDTNTWYPVIMPIGQFHTVRIEVRVSLNSGTTPPWSTHELGFTVRKIWEVNGYGWGTNRINRRILESDCSYVSEDPVKGIGQLTNSSIEYVYVRGGGKYYFYTSHNVPCTLCTTTYTIYSQSVEPTTSTPDAIGINVGYYCSNAGNADYATSAGNADTVDNKHASDFVLSTDFASKELNSNITTITKTLTVTKEWMDTGIKHTDLTTGTYAVQVYSYATDNLIWSGYWSGIMTWYGGTTNSNEADEILLHRGAHAYNGNTIYLRTINSTYEDGRNMRLQIAANKNFNSATYEFKFKKLI